MLCEIAHKVTFVFVAVVLYMLGVPKNRDWLKLGKFQMLFPNFHNFRIHVLSYIFTVLSGPTCAVLEDKTCAVLTILRLSMIFSLKILSIVKIFCSSTKTNQNTKAC